MNSKRCSQLEEFIKKAMEADEIDGYVFSLTKTCTAVHFITYAHDGILFAQDETRSDRDTIMYKVIFEDHGRGAVLRKEVLDRQRHVLNAHLEVMRATKQSVYKFWTIGNNIQTIHPLVTREFHEKGLSVYIENTTPRRVVISTVAHEKEVYRDNIEDALIAGHTPSCISRTYRPLDALVAFANEAGVLLEYTPDNVNKIWWWKFSAISPLPQPSCDQKPREKPATAAGSSSNSGGDETAQSESVCCIVCMADHVKAAFDCGHAVVCLKCAERITADGNKCPVCKKPIKKVRRIYLP